MFEGIVQRGGSLRHYLLTRLSAFCILSILIGGHSVLRAQDLPAEKYYPIEIVPGREQEAIYVNNTLRLLLGIHRETAGTAWYVDTYYIKYSRRSSPTATWEPSVAASIYDSAMTQRTDHFEQRYTNGDCFDKETKIFSNGTEVVVVLLERQPSNHHQMWPAEPGRALMRVYRGRIGSLAGSSLSSYYFKLEEERILPTKKYCEYRNVQSDVVATLRKYEGMKP